MLSYPERDAVYVIDRCTLTGHDAPWPFARANAAEIEAAWHTALAANPHFFNGVVYLVDGLAIDGLALDARLLRTDFKSYLYWRGKGFPESGVRDGFGSALIVASDGAILLGRQRAGNVNGGLAYLPGGFIDGRDVANDGSIDIAASIVRELQEETGLTAEDVVVQPGYLVTVNGAHVSIAKTFRSTLNGAMLGRKIESHLASDPASEFESIVIVRSVGDLEGLAMPPYARLLVGDVLKHGIGGR
ncbi:MAG: NUDIX domain-containing protein [Hyphomicrobium sp.]|nr:NUDIX domain-containing protein [Hyphomicrobium sp.]